MKRTPVSFILFIISIIGFSAIYYQFHISPDTKDNVPLILLLGSFGFLIISEKLCSMINDYLSDSEMSAIYSHLDRFPGLLAGRHDIVVFPNSIESLKYCLSVCELATDIKNTVLRYGISNSACPRTLYDEWIKSKHKTLKNGCTWTEIVSKHIHENDPQKIFMRDVGLERSEYSASIIDDKKSPMMQMTIFTYSNGKKEILFGHEFPTMRHGISFLTNNKEIINYFELYFLHWASLGKDEKSTENNDISIFPNSSDTIEYCLSICEKAKDIKNTVLFYGMESRSSIYIDWINAKQKTLEDGCAWSEIVTTYISDNDPQMKFMEDVIGKNYGYRQSFIDDIKSPMMQVIIFTFADGTKEALFGHEFPDMRHGPSYKTQNRDIIRYFESYYQYWFQLGEKQSISQRNRVSNEGYPNETNHDK